MSEFMRADTATGTARAFRIVKHEKVGLDVAIDEPLGGARHAPKGTLALAFGRAFRNVQLHETIADQKRCENAGLDLLFMRSLDDKPVHHRVHVPNLRLIDFQLFGDIDRLAVDDQFPAALLPQLGKNEIQLLPVYLEYRSPHLHFGAFRQGKDRLENLAARPAWRRFTGSWAMRFADGREQQVEVARDVRH